jgi:hypothetical protein
MVPWQEDYGRGIVRSTKEISPPQRSAFMGRFITSLAIVGVLAIAFGVYVANTDASANGLQSMDDREFDSPIPQLPPVPNR